MSSLSSTARKKRSVTNNKFKVMGEHEAFLSRIKKSMYYGKLPMTERFSLPISELAAELYTEVKSGHSLSRLDIEDAATVSRNACVSPCSLVLALLYLERLKTCNPDYLQRIAPSELFLVSLMVASKFLHDDGEGDEVLNEEWASSAGIEVAVINRYEKDFLQAIEWEVFVSEQAFWKRLCGIERDVAMREGKRRGWFSYTDLDNLLDSVVLSSIAQAFVTISAICLTSYTASVLTLIGSAFIVSHVPGTSMNSGSLLRETTTQPALLTTESSPPPLVHTDPRLNPITTGFILASLSAYNNDTEMVLNSIAHGITRGENMAFEERGKNWTLTSVWILKFLDLSWHWWNFYWNELCASMSKKNMATSGKIVELVANKEMISSFSINKSGVGESEDVWMDVRNWLLVSRYQHCQTKYLPVGIASNY